MENEPPKLMVLFVAPLLAQSTTPLVGLGELRVQFLSRYQLLDR